jgi:hypothetical protein
VTHHLLWSITEPTVQSAINAAIKSATERHGWQPARIVFRAGERPAAITVPDGVTVDEAVNVPQRHFQVWPQ